MQEFYPISSWALFHNSYHPDYIWPISGIEKLLERSSTLTSETFAWYGYPGVSAQAQLTVDGGSGMVYMSLNLFPRDEREPPPRVGPIPTVYYVLRDLRSSRLSFNYDPPRHVVRASYAPFGSTFDWQLKFTCDMFHRMLLGPNTLYNTDDSVVLEVFVEPPSAVRQIKSRDGTLLWLVEDVRARKEAQAYANVQESPYFYTGEIGYRVQARMRFIEENGAVKKTGVMVEMAFLSGEHDADLFPRFPHRATVTLSRPGTQGLSVVETLDAVVDPNRWTYSVFLSTTAFPDYGNFLVGIVLKAH